MYHASGEHRVVHELALPQQSARVDIAVIGNSMVGFEIKTANDTLARLPQQQAAYGCVFDRMFIALEHKHLDHAAQTIPNWWGILEMTTARGTPRFIQRRASRVNPNASTHALVQLLWRDEVLDELTDLGLHHGVRSANKSVLWERLSGAAPGHLSKRDLKSRVRNRLTHREDWRAA
ncbi:sce7726 family protein [Psychromicrobium xiongbiense]|uniref:sce7726 family protein n=1 Tax=Psychromicrobium xiongbiense TaxID=3051184 RepID=UPI003B20B5D1